MRDNSQYLPNTFRTNQNGARPPPERPFVFFYAVRLQNIYPEMFDGQSKTHISDF